MGLDSPQIKPKSILLHRSDGVEKLKQNGYVFRLSSAHQSLHNCERLEWELIKSEH